MKRLITEERSASINRGMLIRSNVPERYWYTQIDAIKGNPSYKAKLVKYCADIAQNTEHGRGLYIYGDHRTGKTALAVFVLKEVLMHRGLVYFLPARDITAVYYDGMLTPTDFLSGEAVPVKSRMKMCNLVVLDDLGAEGFNPKRGAGAELERLFREQYENNGAVVVTGNRNPSDLADHYTTAIADLILRMTSHVKVDSAQWT